MLETLSPLVILNKSYAVTDKRSYRKMENDTFQQLVKIARGETIIDTPIISHTRSIIQTIISHTQSDRSRVAAGSQRAPSPSGTSAFSSSAPSAETHLIESKQSSQSIKCFYKTSVHRLESSNAYRRNQVKKNHFSGCIFHI